MISWNDVLLQYQFPSKCYEEHCDPFNLQNYFVDVIPKYPFPALHPTSNRLVVYLCNNVLLSIHLSDDMLYDFPVLVILTYISSHCTRRQCIYFSKIHGFLSLYDHSDFLKMHMHNAWHLGKTDATMNLLIEYFVSPKHLLFCFCGSLNLYEICDEQDANNLDYNSFLFAASYLMINDLVLFHLLKTSGSVSFRENDTLLPIIIFVSFKFSHATNFKLVRIKISTLQLQFYFYYFTPTFWLFSQKIS